jgi:hypothetical protein
MFAQRCDMSWLPFKKFLYGSRIILLVLLTLENELSLAASDSLNEN